MPNQIGMAADGCVAGIKGGECGARRPSKNNFLWIGDQDNPEANVGVTIRLHDLQPYG